MRRRRRWRAHGAAADAVGGLGSALRTHLFAAAAAAAAAANVRVLLEFSMYWNLD